MRRFRLRAWRYGLAGAVMEAWMGIFARLEGPCFEALGSLLRLS
jgi:hypothetical protein